MATITRKPPSGLRSRLAGWLNQQRITRLAEQVASHARIIPGQKPVVVVNLSSRLAGFSQNAAFTQLAAWGLRLAGIPVVHFLCWSGMRPCVLGTNRQDYRAAPPCQGCVAQSRRLFHRAETVWFDYQPHEVLENVLQGLSLPQLVKFALPVDFQKQLNLKAAAPMPLGKLVLPSIRWALRCHHLPDDEATRYLMRQYLLSAWQVALGFARLLDARDVQAALIFNGIMCPEAAAAWVARQRGVRVITQEVGFQPFSAFFMDGDATAYPITIPDSFELSSSQQARLDAYLEQRFIGKFSMAGIRFWPEIKGLDANFLERAAGFKQVVPVFTNVIYDTSQVHANTIFEHMFDWLETVLEIIRRHPETLFVIRAHPDEMRPGTAKQSRESVHDWVFARQVNELANVIFIDSQEYLSSYELILRSKFLMVYNSSIGLEAAVMGVPVLCGGRARYTQYPTVFLPATRSEFDSQTQDFLETIRIELPPEFQRNARRFLYYQLFRASLPFDNFLKPAGRPGYVHLQSFSWQDLLPERSQAVRVLVQGILHQSPFLLEETDETNHSGND